MRARESAEDKLLEYDAAILELMTAFEPFAKAAKEASDFGCPADGAIPTRLYAGQFWRLSIKMLALWELTGRSAP